MGKTGYEPFNGIVLTDTFNLNKEETTYTFPERVVARKQHTRRSTAKLPIQVIVGNPPWSKGQRSADDDNPNVDYLELEERIRETYVEYSTDKFEK